MLPITRSFLHRQSITMLPFQRQQHHHHHKQQYHLLQQWNPSSSVKGTTAVGDGDRQVTTCSSSSSTQSKPKVLVAVADGTEEIEAVTVVDTLVRAGAAVIVASVSPTLCVRCSRGVRLTADCFIDECKSIRWDMIVCPGGMPGAEHLSSSQTLIELLKVQSQRKQYIAAICASPAVVLARHKMLEATQATCYPAEKFTSMLPHYMQDSVVVDGHIITSQGPGTSMQFSLALVSKLFGEKKLEFLKNEMIIT